MTRTLSTPHRTRRETREDAFIDIRDTLRTHGEMSTKELAERTRLGRDLVDSVCREMEFCRELKVRKAGRLNVWRLPGQALEAEVRPLLQLCQETGVEARTGEWKGMLRVQAPDPFGLDGWVWLDHDGDLEWYLADRETEA